MESLYRRVRKHYTISFWIDGPVFRALLNAVANVKERACVGRVWIFAPLIDVRSSALALSAEQIFFAVGVLLVCVLIVNFSYCFFFLLAIFAVFGQNLKARAENGHITVCLASCDIERDSFEGRGRSRYNLVWISATFWLGCFAAVSPILNSFSIQFWNLKLFWFKNHFIIVKLNCNHEFHKDCIKKWLCDNSTKCPVCRVEVAKGKANL